MFVKKLLIAAVISGAAAGCQSIIAKPAADAGETRMEVRGGLEVFRGGHGLGSIKLDDGKCYDLALPSSVLKDSGRWDTKRVEITGSLQFRPRMEEFMWFDIKDRKIEGFGCSGEVIYVDTIKKL